MLNNKTVAVVVPAYNEEKQIGQVIETMPDFVDRIIVVNDCSTDKTEEVVKQYINKVPALVIPDKRETTILEDKFNRAERILEEVREKQKRLFTPSEIVNENPGNDRVILINHLENGKVGATIATGYLWCRENKISCTAVMAGDGQMDPAELESICRPVIEEDIDYVLEVLPKVVEKLRKMSPLK